jgi:hypothetical protein
MTNTTNNPRSRNAAVPALGRLWWAWIDHLGSLAICEMMASATFWSEEALHGYLYAWTCMSKDSLIPLSPAVRPRAAPPFPVDGVAAAIAPTGQQPEIISTG